MSYPAVPIAGQDGSERRRSTRVPLEMPLQLLVDGEVLARGSIIEARNAATGRSTRVRVAWAWVERDGGTKTIRLALEKADAAPSAWEEEYEGRLREEAAGAG